MNQISSFGNSGTHRCRHPEILSTGATLTSHFASLARWASPALIGYNLVLGVVTWTGVLEISVGFACLVVGNLFLAALIAGRSVVQRPSTVDSVARIAEWASRIRQGDFSARLAASAPELASLEDDINRLAEWLESLAELKDLELREQADRLASQIRVLHLLYDLSGNVVRSKDAATFLGQTIEPLATVLEAGRIEILLDGNDGDGGFSSWSLDGFDTLQGKYQSVVIPLEFGGNRHGECQLWFERARYPLPDEFSQLLYALGQSMGMAIEKIHLDRESVRLSLLRQRTRLANELHDSLAQTVAGLRFQIRILDEVLQQDDKEPVREQMDRVESMLEEANTELRSLIGYFRAPMDPGGLVPALNTLLARFRRESDIAVYFQDNWGTVNLPDKRQLEVVRIVQEALTNIRKHSRAENARVLLRVDGDNDLSVLIEDDGVGIADAGVSSSPGEHIGLSIMEQRARSIGARFQMESEPGEGTRILISFSQDRH